MEINDYNEAKRLFTLRAFKKGDAHSLQTLMQRYVDKHCVVCGKCKGQIRFTLRRFENWFIKNNIQPDAVEDDVKLCEVCNTELTDKRRKICVDCKNK